MDNTKCIIILPTHSNYIGVCSNFLSVLRKNWPSCPYRIVISVTGENIQLENYDVYYNGRNATLTECVVNVVEKYNTAFQLCFLGDAFINKRVDTKWIDQTIALMERNELDYCSLMYVKNYKKRRKFNGDFRFIHTSDRYSHNFVAFISSQKFVLSTIRNCSSDFEFEKKFILENKLDKYYENHIIVDRNIMQISPAITKGKWDRYILYKLKRSNPEITFDNRPIETWGESLYQHAHDCLITLLPQTIRIRAKNYMKRYLKKRFEIDD